MNKREIAKELIRRGEKELAKEVLSAKLDNEGKKEIVKKWIKQDKGEYSNSLYPSVVDYILNKDENVFLKKLKELIKKDVNLLEYAYLLPLLKVVLNQEQSQLRSDPRELDLQMQKFANKWISENIDSDSKLKNIVIKAYEDDLKNYEEELKEK